MRIIWTLLAVLFLSIGFPCHRAFAQKEGDSRNQTFAEKDISTPVPIVFGKKDDDLPEKIKASGVIKEVNFTGVYCGTVFWSGTLKLKLLTKIKDYPYEDVFLIVPCFFDEGHEKKYLNKVVELDVSKLYAEYRGYKKENPYAFELIVNKIDSHGVPFYCTSQGQSAILRNIELHKKDD